MRLHYLCHLSVALLLASATIAQEQEPRRANSPVHDYPTTARVEFVNACIVGNGSKLAALYQCACAIDRIADALSYDEYVEASTFAKYATLPGEGGGEFRDFDAARRLAKRYRELEHDSLRACGMRN